MSKSFPELIRLLAVAGRQLLGLCTSGPAEGSREKGAPHEREPAGSRVRFP